ncbi:Rec8 like protein-domain-containing protein [Protomyces lactucae-debilis]|uniref:Rec8 like protein-domain-containing protein n=1 Tax=Protomyces lactucae-debilis TaxID=2754530 RepID=A0A1Y2FW82_PROLT|nr:Rec8 like protein-domain-containing protein [Protomyces lactucae-debilis]ORY86925.1 Rec8 like protein-domain-containing protein [Protomyces lactucae-debilis]
MFYQQNLLTDKKSGLGVVWLAATLGNKSHVRKLQKRDILSVDVPKACAYLQAPPQPLALRTSSSLMVGVARVLDQQYTFFYADVSQAHTKLRQQLMSMSEKDPATLELPRQARSRMDAVTLPDDPMFDLDFANQGALDFLNHDLEDLMKMDMTKDDNFSNLSARHTSEASGLPSGASPSISLPGGFSSHDLPPPSRSRTGLGNLDLHGLLEEETDPLGPDGAGDMLDFEFDNLGQMQDVEPTQGGDFEPSEKRSVEDESTLYDVDRVRKKPRVDVDPLGVFNEQDEDRAAGLFGDYGMSPLPLAQSTPRPDGGAREFDFFDDAGMDVLVPEDGQAAVAATAATKKRRHTSRVLDDQEIQVPTATMVAWREDYETRMATLNKRRKLRKDEMDKQTFQLIWGFNHALLHPDLTTLYCKNPYAAQRAPTTYDQRANTPPLVEFDNQPEYPMNFDMDAPGIGDFDGADVEIGRRAPSQDPADTVLSIRQQTLPWNISRTDRTPSVGGRDYGSVEHGRAGSLGTPVPFSFMETPQPASALGGSNARRGTLRPGSRLSSAAVAGIGGLERLDSLDAPADLSIDNILDNAGDDPSSGLTNRAAGVGQGIDTQMANDSQFLLSTLQQESYNFFEYTRERIAQHDSVDGQEGAILFENLVEPKTSDRFVASQAFSHVLLLASKGAIHVTQEVPYGSIMVHDLVESA